MTEQEWLRGTDPVRMLPHLRYRCHVARTRAGRRKLRLFGCACCRRVAHLFPDEPGWPVVGLAERLADGDIPQAEVDAALAAAEPVLREGEADHVRQARLNLHHAVRAVCGPAARAPSACSSVGIALRWLGAGEGAEITAQADLLRCIFGNPFRLPPPLPPAVVAWRGGTVARLAAAIYAERDFSPGRLGVLADALEEAGLTDADLLGHLRGGGVHVRGCWALDLVLGKS